MDRFEAAARGAYICFRSAGGKLPSDSKIAALFFLSALTYDEKQIHNDKLTSELTQKMKHSNFEEKLSIMDRLKQICESYHLR